MRRIAIAIAVLVAIVAGVLLSPRLIPASLIRDRTAAELSSLTGRAVTISGTPVLSIYPQITITVDDVAIANPEGLGNDAFVEAAQLRGRLKLLPLLLGRFSFDQFDLTDPRVHLIVDADGRNNWTLAQSVIAKLAADNTLAETVADIRIGHISVINGTVLFDDLRSTTRQEITGVKLEIDWPTATASASGSGSATWRDEPVEFNALVASPVDFLRGKPTGVRFAIASTPVRASFAGRLIGGETARFDGSGAVSTPSLRRTLDWLGTPMGTGAILGAGSVKGGVSWSGSLISFADATIELDGNEAAGTLSADFGGARPNIQATLSATTLDLSPYVEAVRAELTAAGPWLLAPARLAFADSIDAEVHLTADRIVAGGTRIGKASLAAGVKSGATTLKLTNAQFYGGTLSIDVSARNGEHSLETSASIEIGGTPAGVALGDLAGISALDGTTTTSIIMSGAGKSWGELARNVTGSGDVAIVGGSLGGFDLARDLETLSDPLAEPIPASEARTAFTTLGAHLTLAEGTIATGDLTMTGKGFNLTLAGNGSLFGGTVAAGGRLSGGGQSVPIAVDGTWGEPTLARRDRISLGGSKKRESAP